MRWTRDGLPAYLLLLTLAASLLPGGAGAQEQDPSLAYYRAIADHFRLPPGEVMVLAEWGVTAEEVAVVLFLSRGGGVSHDAVLALKRGRSWAELASRYEIDARSFHVPLGDIVVPESLARAYREFRDRPPSQWQEIDLADREIV